MHAARSGQTIAAASDSEAAAGGNSGSVRVLSANFGTAATVMDGPFVATTMNSRDQDNQIPYAPNA